MNSAEKAMEQRKRARSGFMKLEEISIRWKKRNQDSKNLMMTKKCR